MPSESPGVTAVILAAGASQGLLPLTEELPEADARHQGQDHPRAADRGAQRLRREGRRRRPRLQEGGDQAPQRPLLRQRRVRDDQRGGEPLPRRARSSPAPSSSSTATSSSSAATSRSSSRAPPTSRILVDRSFAESGRPRRRAAAARPTSSSLEGRAGGGLPLRRRRARRTSVARVGRKHLAPKQAHGEFVGHGDVHAEGRAPAHRLLPDQLAETARAGDGFHEAASLRRRDASPICSRSSSIAAPRCRPSTSTRAGSRSTPSRTIAAPGRSSRSSACPTAPHGPSQRARASSRRCGRRGLRLLRRRAVLAAQGPRLAARGGRAPRATSRRRARTARSAWRRARSSAASAPWC